MWFLGEVCLEMSFINVIVVCIWWSLFSLVNLFGRFVFPRPKNVLGTAWAVASLVCRILSAQYFCSLLQSCICMLLWRALQCRHTDAERVKLASGSASGGGLPLVPPDGWPCMGWMYHVLSKPGHFWQCSFYLCQDHRHKVQLSWENLDVWSPLPCGNWAPQVCQLSKFF